MIYMKSARWLCEWQDTHLPTNRSMEPSRDIAACQDPQQMICKRKLCPGHAQLVLTRKALQTNLGFDGRSRSVRVIKGSSFEELTTAACIVGRLKAP